MSTDPTPQSLPLDRPRYLQETPDGWQGADHPDGPWRPFPAPQTQPPLPVGEFPRHEEVCQWLEQQAHWGDNAHLIPRIANMVQDALARWGRPAAPPAQEPSLTVRVPVGNNTGAEIPNGTPVYVTGSSGTRITIAPADASVDVENVTAPEQAPAPAAVQPPLWRVMDRAAYPQPHPPGHNYRAAEIRALRDWLAPDDREPEPGDRYEQRHIIWRHNQRLRALLTAEAARAEAGE